MLLQSYFLFPFQTEKLFFSKKFSYFLRLFRSSHRRCSVRKGVLRNFAKFTGKHLHQSLFFNTELYYIKKETLAQVFSCEFCEISKNTFFNRTPLGDCFYLLFAFTKIFVFNTVKLPKVRNNLLEEITAEWDCIVSKNTCFQQNFMGTEKKCKEIFRL